MWRTCGKIERGGGVALGYITLRNGANSKVTFLPPPAGAIVWGFCFAINLGVLDSFFRCRHSFLSALCSSGTGGQSTVAGG